VPDGDAFAAVFTISSKADSSSSQPSSRAACGFVKPMIFKRKGAPPKGGAPDAQLWL
jgi:hypothetical protein